MSTGAAGRTASRPQCLVLVVGTATEIGKTWTGVQVLAALRKGATTVAARKPAQSFDPSETGPTDAEALAAAMGLGEAAAMAARQPAANHTDFASPIRN